MGGLMYGKQARAPSGRFGGPTGWGRPSCEFGTRPTKE
jgi:hypothetical protein